MCKNTTANARYQIPVVNHATFGADEALGEVLFFVDGHGSVTGNEKSIKVGNGGVFVRSNFVSFDTSLRPGTCHSNATDTTDDLLDSRGFEKGSRRNFGSKRSVSGPLM